MPRLDVESESVEVYVRESGPGLENQVTYVLAGQGFQIGRDN